MMERQQCVLHEVNRIHYVPGLWSLALMVPLGLWYLHGQRAFRQERCFNMAFPLPIGQDSLQDATIWRPVLPGPDLTCSGSPEAALPALTEFRQRLGALALAKDTLRILHLHFGVDVKYGTVMHAIESCRAFTDQWMLDGRDLYARYYRRPPPPPAPYRSILGECFLCDDVIPIERPVAQATWLQMKVIDPLVAMDRKWWVPIGLYLTLVLLALQQALRGL